MANKIIIDGYNLLWAGGGNRSMNSFELESERNKLIELLSRYYSYKSIPITVVFDGWKDGNHMEGNDFRNNINITYSRQGEKADEVIKRMVANDKVPSIVVTSDREVADFSKNHGATVIGAREFEDKMRMASFSELKGDEDEYDDYLDKPISTKKKGNPRKLPKAERKKLKKLNKL